MEENKEVTDAPENEKHENNVGMAIVAYFLFFVPLLTDSKNDPFVKFHVKQSLVIYAISLGLFIIRYFLSYIPFIGTLASVLYPFVSLAILALFIIGIVNAINSQKKELPVVGKYAEKWFKF